MTAPILSSDGTALGNPHFYYGRGVGGDDLAIMRERGHLSSPAGQLWERLAEHSTKREAVGVFDGSPRYELAVQLITDSMRRSMRLRTPGDEYEATVQAGRGPIAGRTGASDLTYARTYVLMGAEASGIIRAGVQVR